MREKVRGKYSKPLLMKPKKRRKFASKFTSPEKKIIILFLLCDCEAKIYKSSANHYWPSLGFAEGVSA